jgi:hypothetical protein
MAVAPVTNVRISINVNVIVEFTQSPDPSVFDNAGYIVELYTVYDELIARKNISSWEFGTNFSIPENKCDDIYASVVCWIDDEVSPAARSNVLGFGYDMENPFKGNGTITDPYLVGTPEELDRVRCYQDKYFRQIADIDLSMFSKWRPIGGRGEWRGSYDGGGYKIKNLRSIYSLAQLPDGDITSRAGLFSYVNLNQAAVPGAKLHNIHLENVDVAGHDYTGALAGQVVSGSVEYCSASGGKVEGNFSSGGLIGSIRYSSVSKCFAEVSVKNSDVYTGGLIGDVMETPVSDCYASGNVEGWQFVGGLFGAVFTSEAPRLIERCYASGNVSYINYAGGLIGTFSTPKILRNAFALNHEITGREWGVFWNRAGRITGETIAEGFGGQVYALETMIFNPYNEEDPQPFPEHPYRNGQDVSEAKANSQSTYEAAEFDFEEVWYFDYRDYRPKLRPFDFKPVIYECQAIEYPPRLTRSMVYQ